MRKLRGEVTIFLAMILGLILILLGVFMESITVALDRSYARGAADLAIESVFAEYHTTLLQDFHIFAIEATYESGSYSILNLKERLEFYGVDNMEWEVTQLQLLSDSNGASYEEQILTYMKESKGISTVEGLFESGETWETQRIEGEALEEESWKESELWTEETTTVETSMEETTTEESDTEAEAMEYVEGLDFLYETPILNLVVTDTSRLSEGSVSLSSLPSVRTLEEGVSSYAIESDSETWSSLLVSEYILEHFHIATEYLNSETLSSQEGLLYEVEYILGGKESDKENLESVVNQIVLLRTGVNYTCLNQSTIKKGEVQVLALTMATAMGNPALSEVLEQVLLVAWAYGESIMDVRSLLQGNSISLIKEEGDWQLSLSGLFNLGDSTGAVTQETSQEGLSYEDYLRILLYLEGEDNEVMRSLDMIEERLQNQYGFSYFQVDYCVTQLKYNHTATLADEYTYQFPVAFTYR